MTLKIVAIILGFFSVSVTFAADNMHHDHMKMSNAEKEDQTAMAEMPDMHMVGSLGLPMTRDASGTAWQPDSSPMAMIMVDISDWQFMFHGNIFFGPVLQGSERGGIKFISSNWLMAGVRRQAGPGFFSSHVMLSLEPLSIGGDGYPLLLQTGETWLGQHLHDRQHPHDLFMELSLRYSLPVAQDIGLDFYVAPAGEPALGPVAFPHRISARSNPLAPLGHHWYDSSHISFGVVTVGIFTRQWKLEGSWFNGREPDENRYNIDLRLPDSYSGRISYNPIEQLSMQASYGFLKSPEPAEENISVHRITTSISGDFRPWEQSNVATTAMVGINVPSEGRATAFGLLEVNFDINSNHTVFGRVEAGTKTGAELVLAPSIADAAHEIGALSLGYTFSFPALWQLVPALGGVGTVNVTGSNLGNYYGGPIQFGGMVFGQLRVN